MTINIDEILEAEIEDCDDAGQTSTTMKVNSTATATNRNLVAATNLP